MIEYVIGSESHCSYTPSRSSEIFRIGIETDGIVRELIHKRTESFDESAIYIICNNHKVGIVVLHHIHKLIKHLL